MAAQALPSIPLSIPCLGEAEKKNVLECLETNWISSAGPFVEQFQDDVARFLGVEYAVAVSCGTAALQLAMQLAGVGANDEVVVPALTFIASANSVRYLGAYPVFLDVDPDYWQLDPAKLADFLSKGCKSEGGRLINRATGRRVAAIMPVHLLGHPCDMDPILEMGRHYGIPVVEDAAESLGAEYRGQKVGGLGVMGCFSFNGNKMITTGGGGMLVTRDKKLAERAKYLSTQAKDDAVRNIHNEVGYNFRLTNLHAALGVGQMSRIDHSITLKRTFAKQYTEGLGPIPGITLMKEAPWAKSIFWLYTVLVDAHTYGMDALTLMARLGEHKIESRPLWQPMHRSKAHADSFQYRVEWADHIAERALSLPSSLNMDEGALARVVKTIASVQKS